MSTGPEQRPRAARFLCVLWDCGGNSPPQLAIARDLVQRGHKVSVIAPRSLERQVRAAGCHHLPYRHAQEHDSTVPQLDLLRDWQARTLLGMLVGIRDRVSFGPCKEYAHEVLDALEQESADVVLVDYLLVGAFAGAEKAGVPAAAMMHMPYALPAPGLPPLGTGFFPATGAAGQLRDRAVAMLLTRMMQPGLDRLNRLRAELGLPRMSSAFDPLSRASRILVLTSRAFDFPADSLPANVRYVGPQFFYREEGPAWTSPWPEPDPRPLVLISYSTSFQDQSRALQRAIDGVARLSARVLVTAGPALSLDRLRTYGDVVLREFVPHCQVLPHASVVVTHAGHGTVLSALRFGVPLVCVPMGRDQEDNAARVAWRGLGLQVSSSAGASTLRRATERVLTEPRFRANAKAFARTLAIEDELQAVLELEELEASSRT